MSVCVYVPLMQPHRSTGGNQFTLTSFLHAHSRSRTHTHIQRDLCSDNSAYMCLYVCMSALLVSFSAAAVVVVVVVVVAFIFHFMNRY